MGAGRESLATGDFAVRDSLEHPRVWVVAPGDEAMFFLDHLPYREIVGTLLLAFPAFHAILNIFFEISIDVPIHVGHRRYGHLVAQLLNRGDTYAFRTWLTVHAATTKFLPQWLHRIL